VHFISFAAVAVQFMFYQSSALVTVCLCRIQQRHLLPSDHLLVACHLIHPWRKNLI